MNGSSKKKILLISSTLLLIPAISFSIIAVNEFDYLTRVKAEDHTASCVFNHYDLVEPTEDMHGSKEFWACCTHPSSFLLEAPDAGFIYDRGPLSGIFFDELDENDGRYIAPLPKTRTIKFYCDDLLIDSQYAKDGNKLSYVSHDDFVINGWYKEKELTNAWDFANDIVDGDINLYSKYFAKERSFSVDQDNAKEVDEYGYSATSELEREICVSKGKTPIDSFAVLENRGIIFNKSEIGVINQITINIAENGFESTKLFYGNVPLSFDHSIDLSIGNNIIDLENYEYFTIQNTSENDIKINSINIGYKRKTIYNDTNLPTVVINTKKSQHITSRTTYVDCDISTIGAKKDVTELKAQIKVRGNSTSTLPKKPYRIKLDKKNSLFGYEKAKNWVLLADFMDGSNMHNYTALKFAKMIRGENSFGVDPLHVNVILNGENIGLYLFGEHIDAKEGRLNLEQENIWEKSFDEINFYIERDLSTAQDTTEIEGETYFRVPLDNYAVTQYVFALKYPEKGDFEEILENGEKDTHEVEFQSFFNALKEYITDICNKFVAYSLDKNEFENITNSIDVQSLAEYAIIDQAFREADHNQKSFKMYRKNGGLLKFGPNWDYDSCGYGLPYQGTYVLNPFTDGWNHFESTYFGEKWGYMLFNDTNNGRPLFREIWNNISNDSIESFIGSQYSEMNKIAFSTIVDCERWMNSQYYSVFDNQQYYWKWIINQIPYLHVYYS